MQRNLIRSAAVVALFTLALVGCKRGETPIPAPSAEAHTQETAGAPGARDTSEDGVRFVRQVLSGLRAHAAEAVLATLCADATAGDDVVSLAGQRPELAMDPAETVVRRDFIGADLTGRLGGRAVGAGRISAFNENGRWCVLTVYAFA